LQNPTSKLSEAVQTILEKDPIENLKIHKNYVITVSIEHCDEALNDIYRQVNEILSIESNQNKKVLVIHFGVYKGCGSFQLEIQGRNIKNFGIPDENGNQPRDECIDNKMKLDDKLKTCLDLDSICSNLLAKGHKVCLSESAGEYICNYTYFSSLVSRERHAVDIKDRVFTLFCHVPDFDEINEES
jgi:pyroglutamyl-peptidase